MSTQKKLGSSGDDDPFISVIGEFGRWQLSLCCVQMFTSVMFIWQVLVNKFLAYKVDYSCPAAGNNVTWTSKGEFCQSTDTECQDWVFDEDPFKVRGVIDRRKGSFCHLHTLSLIWLRFTTVLGILEIA